MSTRPGKADRAIFGAGLTSTAPTRRICAPARPQSALGRVALTVSGVISDCGHTGLACSAGSGATGGGLTKVGSGTLTLAGANTYPGPTLVNGGILNVTGSLVSAVTVNAGGMLTGNRTIGGLHVGSGGPAPPAKSGPPPPRPRPVRLRPPSLYPPQPHTPPPSPQTPPPAPP